MQYIEKTKLVILSGLLVCILAISAGAADWQWPSQLTVAGFNISEIDGSTKPDGSGSANGKIDISGIGEKPITLSRNSSGDISGSMSLNTKLSGAELQGTFTLDSSSLKGNGSIKCNPKTINNASVTVAADGSVSGSGDVSLGNANVEVRFTGSGSAFSANAQEPVDTRSRAETPLADYVFVGTMDLTVTDGRMAITAKGDVARIGKLTDQKSEEHITFSVDPSDGQGKANVGGVTVTFACFGS